MKQTEQIAKHFKGIYFGGNYTGANLKNMLADISWEQATAQVHSFNTIAILVFHINYYVAAVLQVLRGAPLNAHDKYSFDCPPIRSEEDWQKLLNKTWTDAEALANLVEQLPESKLWEPFADEKYGNYFRNLLGVIEHTHYHAGQIALIRKIVLETK